jgi:lysophospholipase L1-like esterase
MRKCLLTLILAGLLLPVVCQGQTYDDEYRRRLYIPDRPVDATVKVAPYDTVYDSASNLTTGTAYREYFNYARKHRLRQTGTISSLKIRNTPSDIHRVGVYVRIWRYNGATFDLVSTSENIVSQLIAINTVITVTLSTPIAVQVGDYYSILLSNDGTTGGGLTGRAGQANAVLYYYSGASAAGNGFDWLSQTALNEVTLPVEIYSSLAPTIVFIGDSLVAGLYSFCQTDVGVTATDQSFPGYTSAFFGYTFQNMGIGSQTTTSIAARFEADVVNASPRIVVIEGGINDISLEFEKATFISNWTSMLDAAQASTTITKIVVLMMFPDTAGTTLQMQTRDDWNASLATLALGYSKAIVVDVSSFVGKCRAGGDVGNLWDIQTAYDYGDNIHLNPAGYARVADAIALAIAASPHLR